MLTTDCFKDVARCRELGLGYVLKPVRRSELREAIEGRQGREADSDTRPVGDEGNAGAAAGERPCGFFWRTILKTTAFWFADI